jgi:ABC-type molybdate transport system substrate-binding protein
MRSWLLAVVVALVCASATAAEIRVMAAGSLKDAFTAIFADYARRYGGGFVPVWGPSGVLRERLRNGEAFDVFALAALPHAQALTEAGLSGPSVLFARNALCILTDATRPLDAGNLIETLLRPDIRIGTSTPVADPAGDYTWAMFHGVDALRPGAFETLSKKAQQVFGGAATAREVNGRPRPLLLLDDHQIDLLILYCSSTQQLVREASTYKSVALPPELSVGPEYGVTVSRQAQPAAADFACTCCLRRGRPASRHSASSRLLCRRGDSDLSVQCGLEWQQPARLLAADALLRTGDVGAQRGQVLADRIRGVAFDLAVARD